MKRLLLYTGVTALTFVIGFAAWAGFVSRLVRSDAPEGSKTSPARPRAHDSYNVPLLIEDVSVAPQGAHSSAVSFKVRNVSDTPVSMYVLRYAFSGDGQHAGTLLNRPFYLAPGVSQLDGFSCGFLPAHAPDALKITVEYVEFTDGMRWGANPDSPDSP